MTVVEPRKPVALLAVFAAIGPALVAPVAATPVADAQPVVRDCPGNNYVTLYTNFDELRSYLNGKYRKRGASGKPRTMKQCGAYGAVQLTDRLFLMVVTPFQIELR